MDTIARVLGGPAARLLLVGALVAGCTTARPAGDDAPASHDPGRIEAEEEAKRPIARVEEMLRGRVAGVRVYEGAEGLVVEVRGPASFGGVSSPLVVIDGMPLVSGPGGGFTGLNPADIASIEVLKNPSDVAVYGARGAHGVVLIETKRPPPPAEGE